MTAAPLGERPRIAVVGGGKMGEAIVAGLIAADSDAAAALAPDCFVVADPSEDRRARLAAEHGVEVVADAAEIEQADIVILAVKPQVIVEIAQRIAAESPLARQAMPPLYVSIAAGVETSSLERALGAKSRVVRVMPNMPLQVGCGAAAVCAGSRATEDDVRAIEGLFSALGYSCAVEEADMDAVCAVSGSGPAYVAAFVEELAAAGARQGLAEELAYRLALQTVLGTAKLIADTGRPASEVRESVCSPGGTTLAALDAMNEHGFSSVVDAGVAAAVRRSKELSAS